MTSSSRKTKPAEYEPNAKLTASWESGELGRSEEHVSVADTEVCESVDDALGLQLVSIRLQRELIAKLKFIAKYRGVAYQPLIRDLLNRFARSELRDIVHEMDGERIESNPVVSDFIEREREQKKRA